MGGAYKTDEFSGNSKRPLTPPHHFRKIMLQISSEKPCLKVQNLQHNFFIIENDPSPSPGLEVFLKCWEQKESN